MTPEPRDYVKQLLMRAEQGIHRDGWDQEPFMGTLEWLSPHALAMTKIEVKIENPPGAYIEWLGKLHLDEPEVPQALLDRCRGRFYGMYFACEGWMQATTETEEARRISNAGRSLADIPGSKELRMVHAVDIWGRSYSIHRVRGEKPAMLEDKPSFSVGGRVTEGLRQMTLSVAQLVPEYEEQVSDLKTFFVKDIEEMITTQEFREGNQQP